jgi:hypothetical protein
LCDSDSVDDFWNKEQLNVFALKRVGKSKQGSSMYYTNANKTRQWLMLKVRYEKSLRIRR